MSRPKPNPFTEVCLLLLVAQCDAMLQACHVSYSGLMTREDFGQAVVKTLGPIAPGDINIMFRLVDKEENGYLTRLT